MPGGLKVNPDVGLNPSILYLNEESLATEMIEGGSEKRSRGTDQKKTRLPLRRQQSASRPKRRPVE